MKNTKIALFVALALLFPLVRYLDSKKPSLSVYDLSKKIEVMLKVEWSQYADVDYDGLFTLKRLNQNFNEEVCSFHISGVSISQENGAVVIKGVIAYQVAGYNKPLNSIILTRNTAIVPFLHSFKEKVLGE